MCIQYSTPRGPGSFSVTLQNPKPETYLGSIGSVCKIHAVKIFSKWGNLQLEKSVCKVELEKTVLRLVNLDIPAKKGAVPLGRSGVASLGMWSC